MFINCPYCRALVATDPVTDLPPTHCPQCASLLRRDDFTATHQQDSIEAEPLDLGDLLSAPQTVTTHDAGAIDASVDPATPMDSAANASNDAAANDAIETNDIDVAVHSANDVDRPAVSGGNEITAPAIAAAKRGPRGMPSFVRGPKQAALPSRERWLPAAAAALALLLALQLLLADRARLAADAQWRPVLTTLCRMLSCALPPWREPAAFTLLQRDVRQHPSIPGALRVSATLRNDARWPQPWPELQLNLSDVNGQAAGGRSFHADEYLGGKPSQPELASGESATVAMDVLEPAARIVAYDFSFR
jgi:Protein of unknown function (DUF3426)